MGKCELLAPVGDFRNLRAAVEAGADAVYFGIRGFNMRETAKNFEVRDLVKMRKICSRVDNKHQTGLADSRVKMYLVLNTVIYDEELKRVEDIVKRVAGKIDAVICWDLAVIGLCKKYKIPFHVSTQASVSNIEAAEFYRKLGAERIVLARELSLKQVKRIAKFFAAKGSTSSNTGVPSENPRRACKIEAFCHGAMCVAVSGRCFMSQHLTGCSANRGKCLQFCRRSWQIKDERGNELRLENSRIMSAKDLCTLPFIDEMKKAGIMSFKIEGRNRSPEYVSVVVGEYRKALDKKLSDSEIKVGLENLNKVYNRGFSSGFYLGVPTADDFSWSEHGEQEERKEFVGKVYKVWRKVGAVSLKMNAGRLRVGDEVYLMSDEVGVVRSSVESIELGGKSVKMARKGDDVGVVFGDLVGSGTEVYVIGKK